MDKKKVFIVTDNFLFNNGYTKCITDKLEEIFYQTLGLTKRDGMDMSAGPIKK